MLMSLRVGKIGITTLLLMDALDQSQLLELFEGAINGDQSQRGILPSCQVVDFSRSQCAGTLCYSLDDSAARIREAVAL